MRVRRTSGSSRPRRADVDFGSVSPTAASDRSGRDDAALARLDVLPTIDGIEPGIWEIGRLEAEGVRVFNGCARCSRRTTSSRRLAFSTPRACRTHTRSIASPPAAGSALEPPVVVKPRFGSWGRDVLLCEDRAAGAAALEELSTRPWFRRQGVLVQELVPPLGHDLRIVVAAGQIVGAVTADRTAW